MTFASFNEAVTAAQGRHQEAVRVAHEEFNAAVAKADRGRDELYAAAPLPRRSPGSTTRSRSWPLRWRCRDGLMSRLQLS